AFRDDHLRELRLVANAVKHGDDGPSWRELRAMQAPVTSADRLEKDWTVGEFSTLNVSISVRAADVRRYQAAIQRFWKLAGADWGGDAALAAGGAVILGHMFPVWLGFRGGKGVATALGVLLAIAWPVAIAAAALWLATAIFFHYSSLAALVGAVAAVLLAAV